MVPPNQPGDEPKPMVLVLQLPHATLPTELKNLFGDPTFTFVGRCVGADISRIGKDFNCTALMATVRKIDLGPFARTRDVVRNGNASLEALCKVVLKKRLPKLPHVRLSKWSAAKLSDEQVQYAALDAAVGMQIYHELRGMPDLNARITPEAAVPGVAVDLVPFSGSVSVMATYAGWGTVVEPGERVWMTPANCTPDHMVISTTRRVVRVDTLTAPLLRVPGLKCLGKPATLGDLKAAAGGGAFQVLLPLRMLSEHVAGRVRPTPADGGGRGAGVVQNGGGGGGLEENAGGVGEDAMMQDEQESSREMPGHVLGSVETEQQEGQQERGRDRELDQDEHEQDGDGLGGGLDADHGNPPSPAQIEELRSLLAILEGGGATPACRFLKPAPSEPIIDKFSPVIEDGFHAMDRAKVKIHHPFKKAYFHAFMLAWFAYDPVSLEAAKVSTPEP